MLSPRVVFITGANRGLGLEFVKQFLKLVNPPDYLFATCRDPEEATVSIVSVRLVEAESLFRKRRQSKFSASTSLTESTVTE